MSVLEVQEILRNKHIVVTNCPTQSLSFDAKGLRTLANLEVPIDIQGPFWIDMRYMLFLTDF